jgi:hypothetical protein
MGKYNDQEGRSSTCEGTCPAGYTSRSSSLSTCVECSAGLYQDEVPSEVWVCKNCQLGYYGTGSKSICDPCPKGKYQSEGLVRKDGVDQCKACEKGKYGPNSGSPNCTDFPAGTFFGGTGATNVAPGDSCDPGKYSNAGAASCTGCPPGRFGDEAGGISIEAACMPCYSGQFQPSNAGEQTCKTCSYGQASPPSKPAVAPCVPCVDGQYQDLIEATSYGCKSCVPGECYSVLGMISYFAFDGFF